MNASPHLPARKGRTPAPLGRRRRALTGSARERLLEAAGEVFAKKGFAHATGAEIGRRARVNAAAVNYYFGSKEGLHAAVVREAHHRLISLEALSALVAQKRSAKARLQEAIELVAGRLSGAQLSWELPVLAREIVSPSNALVELREREILPKAALLKSIVGDLLGLPPDHPSVALSCLSVVAPLVMLAIIDRGTLGAAFPALVSDRSDASALAEHMLRFTLAGLQAVKRDVQTRGRGKRSG